MDMIVALFRKDHVHSGNGFLVDRNARALIMAWHMVKTRDRNHNEEPVWVGMEPTDRQLAEIIVCYYNGTDIADAKRLLPTPGAPEAWRGLIGIMNAVFTTYLIGLPERIEHGGKGLSWIDVLGTDLPEIPSEEMRNDDRALKELQAKRKNFCGAVKWLCSRRESPAMAAVKLEKQIPGLAPTSTSSKATAAFHAALASVRQESRKLLIAIGEGRKAEDEKWRRYFECHGVRHVHHTLSLAGDRLHVKATPVHIIDLFCAFLVKGAQFGHANMPVKLCNSCGRLFSVVSLEGGLRERKEHCSAKCQQRAYWGPRRKDHRYVERLEECSPRRLRERLPQPKVQIRLREIETRWKSWQGIQQRIRDLRKSAAGKAKI